MRVDCFKVHTYILCFFSLLLATSGMKLDKLYFCGFNEPVTSFEKKNEICLCNLFSLGFSLLHNPKKDKKKANWLTSFGLSFFSYASVIIRIFNSLQKTHCVGKIEIEPKTLHSETLFLCVFILISRSINPWIET